MAKIKTKEEAAEAIKKLIAEADTAIYKATEIADEWEVDFTYHPEQVGDYTARRLEWAASSGCEWETSDEYTEGSWSPETMDWSSSSVYC